MKARALASAVVARCSQAVSGFFHGVGNLVFPSLCAACDAPLDDEPGLRLCLACREAIAPTRDHRCLKCGARVAVTFVGEDCPWCREHELRFDRTVTIGSYDDPLRGLVLKLKHPRTEALSLGLSTLLAGREAETLQAAKIDVVAPIPMHWRRRLVRGHNGPELVAGYLARLLQTRSDRRLLVRLRDTQPQAGLSPAERRENVHQAFAVRRGRVLRGRRVLIVDDILTTGATASEAAKVLKKAGAAAVAVAVLARAQGET